MIRTHSTGHSITHCIFRLLHDHNPIESGDICIKVDGCGKSGLDVGFGFVYPSAVYWVVPVVLAVPSDYHSSLPERIRANLLVGSSARVTPVLSGEIERKRERERQMETETVEQGKRNRHGDKLTERQAYREIYRESVCCLKWFYNFFTFLSQNQCRNIIRLIA